MTSSLFQEALADAKQLKEVAEQNAKNAIIDAVTPKIRKFIEDQLLEGARKDSSGDLDEEASDEDIDLTTDGSSPVDLAGSPEELAERANLMHAMSRIAESLTPEESAALIPIVEKMRDASLKPGSAGISRAAPSDVRSTHIVKENAAMQGKNKMYEVDLDELMSDEMPHKKEAKHMGKKHAAHDADEMSDYDMEEGMHGMGHDMEEDMGLDMDEEAEDEMADLYESLAALYEADDDEADDEDAGDDDDMAPLSAADEDEEEDAGEDDDAMSGGLPPTDDVPAGMEAVKQDIVDVVRAELEDFKQEILAAIGGGAEAPAAAPAEDMGAEPPAPSAGPAMPPGASPGPSERVYRVNEAALMRELKALREGKKKNGNGNGNGKPKDEVLDTGLDEGNYDLEEEAEIDEMVDSEGMHTYEGRGSKGKAMAAHTPGHGPGKAVPYSEAAKMKVMKENRDLKVSLAKHAEAINSLRGQLTEMNLFNAKLLYVNRLLQDRDLTDAQRRNIIESLDRAQSLREVKLLYKGLSESIGRKAPAKKSEMVNESVGSRTVSSSSRPLSSSGVRLNEAVEVHRWALLAGIGSKS